MGFNWHYYKIAPKNKTSVFYALDKELNISSALAIKISKQTKSIVL